MSRRRMAAALLCSLLFANIPTSAQTPTPTPPQPSSTQAGPQTPQPTPDIVERIKDEGMNRSQVMQTLNYLSNVIGPRLTASPSMKRANEWTRDKLTEWGLSNAHLEAWGPFGRGWVLKRFSAEVVEPQAFPLFAYPKAWSPATAGPLDAEVVYVGASNEQELEKYKGQLKGKIVLNGPVRDLKAHFDPDAVRATEKQLLDLANEPDPATRPPRRPPQGTPDFRAIAAFNAKKMIFYQDEGAALVVDPSRGDDGTIFVQQATVPQPAPANPNAPAFGPGAPHRIQPWDKDAPRIAPQMVLSIEQYNRIARMLEAGEHVRLSVNLDDQFLDQDPMAYNTVAEIPGTDLKDEVVMLGGHMDSWHGGTGATDNGAGVAVAMEAVRIIKALGLQPRRTIRVALWSGEEQGLFGSRAYVEQHFGRLDVPANQPLPTSAVPQQRGTLTTKPDYDKLSAYFNLDNGTGRIRGIYMQGNESVRPLFRSWLAPFADMGAQTLTLANTGSTDHVSFDDIGLPGFQFIQDTIDYSTRTHHSTQDTYERIQADDMKQAAVIMAAFVYQTAMLDQKLPRKAPPGR
jgi:carboxypeptidase Q